MLKNNLRSGIWFVIFLLGLSCKTNPISKLVDPNQEVLVPGTSGVYFLYLDELFTSGGVQLIPGGENQIVDFSDRSEPRQTRNHLKYQWNGGDVFDANTNAFRHDFAGIQLTHGPATTATSLPGLDLSGNPPGYTQLIFDARGTLSDNTVIKIEGPDDGPGGITPVSVTLTSSTLTTGWRTFSLPVTASHFSDIRIFFTATFQFTQPPRTTNPGNGGTVIFDNVRYAQ